MSRPLATFAVLIALAAAGCASPRAEVPVVAASAAASPPAVAAPAQDVTGWTAPMLVARFGAAALDLREGPARKLQFDGAACILDVYLYPPAAGGEPVVTHADARSPAGEDVDRASCVAALAAP